MSYPNFYLREYPQHDLFDDNESKSFNSDDYIVAECRHHTDETVQFVCFHIYLYCYKNYFLELLFMERIKGWRFIRVKIINK